MNLFLLQLLKNLRRSVTTLDICGQWGEKGDEATLVRYVKPFRKQLCHPALALLHISDDAAVTLRRFESFTSEAM